MNHTHYIVAIDKCTDKMLYLVMDWFSTEDNPWLPYPLGYAPYNKEAIPTVIENLVSQYSTHYFKVRRLIVI